MFAILTTLAIGKWAVAPAEVFDHGRHDTNSPVFWDDHSMNATTQGRSDERPKILRILNAIEDKKDAFCPPLLPPTKNFTYPHRRSL